MVRSAPEFWYREVDPDIGGSLEGVRSGPDDEGVRAEKCWRRGVEKGEKLNEYVLYIV